MLLYSYSEFANMPKEVDMIYQVSEIFYSLQGEGLWTGEPALFIRLAGCNINCEFCDTDYEVKEKSTASQILHRLGLLSSKCGIVILTGGEPLIQDPLSLLDVLQSAGYRVHLETNGQGDYMKDIGRFDWVAMSPKYTRVDFGAVIAANEIKFLCGTPNWVKFINEFLLNYELAIKTTKPDLKLIPLDEEDSPEMTAINTGMAIAYCKDNPKFSLCLQTHKMIGVR